VNRLLVHPHLVEDERVEERASASEDVLGLLVDRRSDFLVAYRDARDPRERELEADSIGEVGDLEDAFLRTPAKLAAVNLGGGEVFYFVCSFVMFTLFHSGIIIPSLGQMYTKKCEKAQIFSP